MRVKNLQQVMDAVRPNLAVYLEYHGRSTLGEKFQCPNAGFHKNNDSSPSASFFPDSSHFHCFACQTSGDIFKAATLIEGRPAFGTEFITDNVLYLAQQFKIPYEVEESDTQDKKVRQMCDCLELAASMLHLTLTRDNPQNKAVKDYVAKRGWTPLVEDFQLGWGRYDRLIEKLREKGFSDDIIKDCGIMNRALVDNRLIIPIKNHYGRVVALASRALDPDDKIKYINCKTTLIYKKDSLLFNLHQAKANSTVIVVEGYADVLTLWLNGIKNAVAVCTNMLTESQYEVMTKCGIQKMILCLDSDPVNKEVYERIVNGVIKDKKDIEILIKELPYEEKENIKDPDSYIVKYGVKKFQQVPEQTVFEHRLEKIKKGKTHDGLARDNVLFAILREESALTREQLCRRMADETEYSFDGIKEELNRLEEGGAGGTGMMMSDILRERSMTTESINDFETWAWSRTEELLGLKMGFPMMTRHMDGLQQGLYLIGGKANVGKSAFCQQLCLNIVLHNLDKVHMLYFTIDDDIRKMIPRLVASQAGIPINTVSNPVFKILKNPAVPEEAAAAMEKKRAWAVDRLRELSTSLYIRDASHGKTLEYISETIKKHKFIAGEKQLVVFIDNLHKIRLANSKEKGKEKFTAISEELKELSNKLDIPLICTVEFKKTQEDTKGAPRRPTEEDIKETADLGYDADVVMLVFNEMHHLKNKAVMKHYDEVYGLMPVLEVIIAKNKLSEFKGTLFYRFWPAFSRLEECTAQEHTTKQF